jgi:hypothetical protein
MRFVAGYDSFTMTALAKQNPAGATALKNICVRMFQLVGTEIFSKDDRGSRPRESAESAANERSRRRPAHRDLTGTERGSRA